MYRAIDLCREVIQAVNPKVRIAVAFVEANLRRDIYVADAAKLVRLSRSRFCHLFKSETSLTFIQYVRATRLERSRQRLEKDTLESVKAIALEVGYKDSNHFEREFKKAYGVTPSQHRAQYLARMTVEDRPA